MHKHVNIFSNFKRLTNTRLSTHTILTETHHHQYHHFRVLSQPLVQLHQLHFHLLPQQTFKAPKGAAAVSVCYTVTDQQPTAAPQQKPATTVVTLLSKLPQTRDHFTIKQNRKRNDVWKHKHVNRLRNYA